MQRNRGRRGRAALGLLTASALGLALAGCAASTKLGSRIDPKYGVASSPRVVEAGQPVPKGGGVYRVGKPYMVAGRSYVPQENAGYRTEGMASWYGDAFHGRLTANGEIFDKEAISAAHPTLPMPSYVRVTNLRNGKSLIVRVNDRGPFHSDRVIDLSHKAADLLEFRSVGVARVRVEYVGPASLEGSDDRRLLATLRHGEPAPAPVQVASARPSLPFGGGATAASASARMPVPVPGARPFSLGEGAPAVSSEVSASRIRQAAAESGGRGLGAPVSAFAAPRYDAPAGVMSGRGLY